ncbi:MAG TPA: ribbon-helix-helix domain-containing protein [Methyloceanibacter sp.]
MPKLHNKRSVTIDQHRTSISLEAPFWDALSELAGAEGKSVAALIGEIDKSRGDENLSAAIRLYVLEHSRR